VSTGAHDPKYLPIDMPDEFVLEVPDERGSWVDYGHYRADRMEMQADGSYLYATDGLALVLRCVEQQGDIVRTLDGNGDALVCRLRPICSGAD